MSLKMKKILVTFLAFLSYFSYSEQIDTLRTYEFREIEVLSRRQIPFVKLYDFGSGYNSELLNSDGYQLVRRGLSFSQDLYSDGFKKGDVRVLIDGEYYHNACPNRMDAPITRVNLLDMSVVEVTKSAGILSTGLYGKVEYHRTKLEKPFKFKTLFSGQVGSNSEYDFGFSVQSHWTNLNARISMGTPYQNADGLGFDSLYNYKGNAKFTYGNLSLRKLFPKVEIEAGINFIYAKDISFPYLMMDERSSKVFSGYLQYKRFKGYINYTDHLMNNGLRISGILMETQANNITAGLKGDFFELIYRKWKADNVIGSLSNRMLPNVEQFEINVASQYNFNFTKVFLKGGINYIRYRDVSRKSFFEVLYPNAKTSRIFVSAGISGYWDYRFSSDFFWSVIPEFSIGLPEPEQLFLALNRPMSNPDWSGNPLLNQPLRTSVRTTFQSRFFNIELFGNYIINYIDVVVRTKESKKVMTYDNTEAIIAGTNLSFYYKWLSMEVTYLWGEDMNSKKPLAEIAPLSLSSTFKFPIIKGFVITFSHRWENAQKRVNYFLKEFPAPAWNSFGLGVEYSWNELHFDFRVQNLLNHNYYRFLSYSRNPFSAGMPIYEPGRVFVLTIYYNNN